ncbi:MAG: transketolase C-terminal domain-containing protein [Candidatus Paceibacterota bacterium]
MIVESQKLNPDIFSEDVAREYTRDGYGKGLVEVADENDQVVALCADLAESTRTHWFKEKYPDRYIELGVAEQNMATVASGMANYGKIPFIASYAAFSPGRNNEQIRTTISLNEVPVKIVGCHAGVSVGPDGATHQALEDIALMRVQPNMNVMVGCDMEEVRKIVHAAVKIDEPVYIRMGRSKTPMVTTKDSPLELGKANLLWESDKSEASIIACGILVHNSLVAAKELEEEGIKVNVLNNHTIKPIDEGAVIREAQRAGAVVTVEEHQIAGGMGSAVAEVLVRNNPVPQEFVGVEDRFGQSGQPDELIEKYGMGVEDIKKAVKRVIERK